ncbi:MAG TPA: TonB-dependent receptor, partial [Vicinamibacteria bacterium]|nr:TonB-dependent receptor [Vicinamibacteria bacterium]
MRAGRLPPSAAVVLVSLAALAAPFPASAQANTGTILGTVRDPSGATLSGAWVRVRNLDTGESREVETMGGGLYRAPGLGLGRYEVRVERAGFQPSVRTGIALSVSEEAVVDLELVLGAVREAVVVEASAAPVETTRATLSHLVDGRRIRFLPLNGRDYAQLLLLQPGVVLSRSSAGSANVGRGIKVSVAGARPNQNLFTLDGTDLNDALNTTPASAQGLMTGVESVQEFRVVTQAMSAEYGRAVGGVFQVATRSGTNTFHGSAFAFHRNDALDARNYFDLEKPDFSRHQFGGTLGGPLARDRTFFFMGYEGLREGKGITQVAAVPDAEARRGRLPGRAPFAVNPLVAPYLRLFPEANGPLLLDAAGGPTGLAEYRGVLDRGSTEDMGLVRLDHRFSGTDSLFVRYLFGRSELDEPVNLPQFPNVVRHRRHLLTLEQRHLFSPSVLSELRLGLGRSQPSEDVQPDDPYEALAFVPGAAFGELVVGGGATAVGTDRTNPKRFHQDQLQVSETVYVQAGRHALKAGLGFSAFRFDGHSETRTRGQLRFRSLEDFLRGRTRDFQVALPGSDFTRRYRQELFGAYVQDDFRVRPRLTLNLGLRYELATTPREADGKVSNLRRIEDARMTVGDPLFR